MKIVNNIILVLTICFFIFFLLKKNIDNFNNSNLLKSIFDKYNYVTNGNIINANPNKKKISKKMINEINIWRETFNIDPKNYGDIDNLLYLKNKIRVEKIFKKRENNKEIERVTIPFNSTDKEQIKYFWIILEKLNKFNLNNVKNIDGKCKYFNEQVVPLKFTGDPNIKFNHKDLEKFKKITKDKFIIDEKKDEKLHEKIQLVIEDTILYQSDLENISNTGNLSIPNKKKYLNIESLDIDKFYKGSIEEVKELLLNKFY